MTDEDKGTDRDGAAILAAYAAAKSDLDAWERANAFILGERAALVCRAGACEASLRAWARDNGPIANDGWAVTVNRPMRRRYDVAVLISAAPWLSGVEGLIRSDVDREKIDALVKSKLLDAAIAKAALVEEVMTPSVMIRQLAAPDAGSPA